MQKKKKIDNLEADERELLDSLEKGEWKSASGFAKHKQQVEEAAAEYLAAHANINLSLSRADLVRLEEAAALRGQSREILITHILHEYLTKS